MGDNFDDQIPPEEEAEDFANFDPERYLRKRQGQYGRPMMDEETADVGYTPGRRRRYAEDDLAAAPGSGRSRRRSGISSENDFGESLRPAAGVGAGIIGLVTSGEGMRLLPEILRQGGPLVRAGLTIGCVLLIALVGACGVACLLAFSVLRR